MYVWMIKLTALYRYRYILEEPNFSKSIFICQSDLGPHFKVTIKRPYEDPSNREKIKGLSHVLLEIKAFEIWRCIYYH